MKKKLVACLLVAAMTIGLTACGKTDEPVSEGGVDGPTVSGETVEFTVPDSDIVYHKATDLTDKEITLTVISYLEENTAEYLANRFMEIYPNIKVVTAAGGDDFNATITSLIQANTPPDVVQYTDSDTALSNMWLYDMTSLWNSDPETKELPDTVTDTEHGIGTYDTGHRFGSPALFYPGIMYVDRNVFEKLNVELPGQDWTWQEMIDLIRTCTTEVNGVKYFGLGFYNRLDSYYGIASSQDVIGEFGFNGTDFDLSAWADGEQEFSDLKNGGYIAPQKETQEMEDWYGDWGAWCGSTGQVAMFSEAFWTFQNIWNTEAYLENYDLDIVPYVIPAVSEEDAAAEHHSLGQIDMGGIMYTTQYPREAYELMKFMFWSRDGWLTKIELYHTDTTNSEGTLLKNAMMTCPITNNEEVWDAYFELYCEGMDDEHVELWREYFDSCMSPISFGWENIAGYWTACTSYFNAITATTQNGVTLTGIHDIVDKGAGKAVDYKAEAQTKFNYYHADAMIRYFGPDLYDILSDEDIEFYEQMMEDNKG